MQLYRSTFVVLGASAISCATTGAVRKDRVSSTDFQNWLYTSQIDETTIALLDRPDINGVQALYSWKTWEPEMGQYNFTAIFNDLDTVQSKGKQLWVQLQDRTFSIANVPTPSYMSTPFYNNGSVPQCDGDDCDNKFEASGWVAQQWNQQVRERFQALLQALARSLDGRIFGINFAETSIGVENANGFTCQAYFDAELENAKLAANLFHKTYVVQYVNFWPCGYANENNYLSESFEFYAKNGVGVGGPDDIPFKKAMEANAYPFMLEYSKKVPITVVAVQEPDLKAINPNTTQPFTKEEFTTFAKNQLGVTLMFWATSAPWLQT